MTMKQTQTKMFDFSDTGLDFSAGSKNLFPDRFKKMLALGYNVQTVSNVTVAGNQVTFTYGGAHGYAVGRVLKVNSGALTSINGGEFVVDSITTDTVTMTIDTAPFLIAGNFTTHIASLGYEIVYEKSNIHIYKFKHIDDTDLYLRLVFQGVATYRNRVAVCIGKTADLLSGTITDPNSLSETRDNTTPETYAWEFTVAANSTYNNYSYSQGYSLFGKGMVVGSLYHLAVLNWSASSAQHCRINGFFPTHCFNYNLLDYPILFCGNFGNASAAHSNNGQLYNTVGSMFIGNVRVMLQNTLSTTTRPQECAPWATALNSFLPTSLDDFNTTACGMVLNIFEYGTLQFIGVISGGIYSCGYYNQSGAPLISPSSLPLITTDIDFGGDILIHAISINAAANSGYYAFPVEEIKIVS